MVKHLYLMRHGETLFNRQKKIQGWCDSPLTDVGIKQAKAAKVCLEGIEFDHYYCSTSERCSDTLEIITEGKVEYTRLKSLKERCFGAFEGESEFLNPPRGGMLDYDDIFPHYGGEYRWEVIQRMKNCLTDIMEKDDHHTVLAVSHGGACYSFLSTVCDPNIVRDHGGFTNCCILHFEFDNGIFKYIGIIRPEVKE